MANGDDTYEIAEDDEEMLEAVLSEGKWEEAADDDLVEARYRRGRSAGPMRRTTYQPRRGVNRANIQTPAGNAQVQFSQEVAPQEAVNKLARELKSEIASVIASVKKVDAALDKNTAMLDKKVNKLTADFKNSQQQSMMLMMLPMMMQKPPQIDTLNVDVANSRYDPTSQKLTQIKTAGDTATTYKSTDDMTPLLLMMMTGGMGGSGTDSSNQMAMMMMAVAMMGNKSK